jgi:CRP-like cAMP-binding protein
MLAIEQTNHYIGYTTGNDAIGRQWLRDATALPPQRQERNMAQSTPHLPHPHLSNRVLASLAAADIEQLLPHLRSVDLPQETVLFEAGDTIDRVHFPHGGVVSLVVELTSGEMIEAAMIGREGVVGGLSALDSKISISRAIVQIAGAGSVADVEHVRQLAEQSVAFRATLIRHEQVLLAQSQQSAACNAAHTIEARLSRWLLRCRDLIGSEDLPLTQEFIAQMLGVRRTSVSIVAHTLQQAGLIRYKRGHIRVLDLEGLRESACECYWTVKSLSDRLIGAQPEKIQT